MLTFTAGLETLGAKGQIYHNFSFRLEHAGEDVRPHELFLEDNENDRLPPMFGQFCCRLAVQPYCREEPVLCGSLSLRYPLNERYSGGRWAENCWARLMDFKLCLWQSLEQYEAARSPSKQVIRIYLLISLWTYFKNRLNTYLFIFII